MRKTFAFAALVATGALFLALTVAAHTVAIADLALSHPHARAVKHARSPRARLILAGARRNLAPPTRQRPVEEKGHERAAADGT
jgi:hypothetical protein